jgi:low temperature requirement protein LtrA
MTAIESNRSSALRLFKRWFWHPPRAHGDTIVDRRVSALELLYDLVYVVVIAQAGRHLSDNASPAGIAEFALVFSLTWLAWTNGSLYLELHGRLDGRTRTYVFVQIGILAILAVFADQAGDSAGPAFAITYAAYLGLMTWLWYDVRRQDVIVARREFLLDAGRYVVAIGASVVVMVVSALLPSPLRLWTWAVLLAAWVVVLLMLGRSRVGLTRGMTPTYSLVERFGLFTIIVLGEVVFGVVDGLSRSKHDVQTIATGMIALVVGFGFWWIYFDVVGGRLPKSDGGALANWILSHYPITLSIAAAGAGMVSLLEHAHDPGTPAAIAMLLAGSAAVGLIALVLTSRALSDFARLSSVFRPLTMAMVGGAIVSVAVGFARPAPWLLALLLVAILGVVWAVAVRGFLLAGAWSEDQSQTGVG